MIMHFLLIILILLNTGGRQTVFTFFEEWSLGWSWSSYFIGYIYYLFCGNNFCLYWATEISPRFVSFFRKPVLRSLFYHSNSRSFHFVLFLYSSFCNFLYFIFEILLQWPPSTPIAACRYPSLFYPVLLFLQPSSISLSFVCRTFQSGVRQW